jgi:hydrogenase maturation protease
MVTELESTQEHTESGHGASASTLILGIGNTLLRDEGVGVTAMNALVEILADDDSVRCMDGGTLSFTLAGPIEEASQLIVIDAADLDGQPGQVRVFENEAMEEFLGTHRKRSVHEVGLIDLMIIARLTDRVPSRRALIAVQPGEVDWGENPTEAVKAALPRVCEAALELIRRWRHELNGEQA